MKRHWTERDFRIYRQTPAFDGSNTVNRFGSCAVCGCDMQSFGKDGKLGPILHYKSKGNARRVASMSAALTGLKG